MKPSRSHELYGPGIGGANVNIESCDVEADCAVCGRHFAAYTGMQNWPYKLDQSDLPGGAGLFRRMCCSWSCLCRWRREHPAKAEKEAAKTPAPLPEKSPEAVRALARSVGKKLPKPKKAEPVPVETELPEDFVVVGGTVTNFDRWKLAGLRAKREISRATLQRLCGISIGGIRDLEYGKNLPQPGTVRKLAAAFGVEPKELLKD